MALLQTSPQESLGSFLAASWPRFAPLPPGSWESPPTRNLPQALFLLMRGEMGRSGANGPASLCGTRADPVLFSLAFAAPELRPLSWLSAGPLPPRAEFPGVILQAGTPGAGLQVLGAWGGMAQQPPLPVLHSPVAAPVSSWSPDLLAVWPQIINLSVPKCPVLGRGRNEILH